MAALCALAVAGCGGGGEGGGGDGGAGGSAPVAQIDNSATVALASDSVAMAYLEGAPYAVDGSVQATLTGTVTGTLYAGAGTADGQPDPQIERVEVIATSSRTATVTVTPKLGLAAGSYSGVLQLRVCPDAACSRQFSGSPLRLAYTVSVGQALAVPAAHTVTVNSETAADVLTGTVPVDLGVAAKQLLWSASSSAEWLALQYNLAAPGEPLVWRVLPDKIARLPADADAVADIHVEVNGRLGNPIRLPMAVATLRITLKRAVADIDVVSPNPLVAGRAAGVILQGHGMSGLADPTARLRVTDGAGSEVRPSQVTRLSDTALRLELPALPAGVGQVCLSNALNLAAQCGTLVVQAPQALPAAANATGGGLPGGNSLGGLLHDPRLGWLYLANRGAGVVQRWPDGSGAGSGRPATPPQTLAMPNLDDIALSPDGAWLIATQRDGRLHLIDPRSFTSSISYVGPNDVYAVPSGGHGLAVTNDGRVWLTLGTGDNTVHTFNLRTRTFERQVFGNPSGNFQGGPWFEVSRNGERLVAVQGASPVNALPLLVMNTSQPGQWRSGPADPSFFYWSMSGLDDTGNTLQVMGGVWDADFTARGRLALPEAGWVHAASVLSPDGKRLYVHALPPDWADPAGTTLPKVHVFDATYRGGAAAALPLLGGWSLNAWATCRSAAASLGTDCQHPQMAISADGRSLFIAGTVNLLVAPVPDGLR